MEIKNEKKTKQQKPLLRNNSENLAGGEASQTSPETINKSETEPATNPLTPANSKQAYRVSTRSTDSQGDRSGKCSFFAVVGSIFSNFNFKRNGTTTPKSNDNHNAQQASKIKESFRIKKLKKKKLINSEPDEKLEDSVAKTASAPPPPFVSSKRKNKRSLQVTEEQKKKLTNFEALLSILYSSKDYVNKLNKNKTVDMSADNTPSSITFNPSTLLAEQQHFAAVHSSGSNANKNEAAAVANTSLIAGQIVNKGSFGSSPNRNSNMSMNRNSSYINDKIDFFLTNTNTNEILYNKDQNKSEGGNLSGSIGLRRDQNEAMNKASSSGNVSAAIARKRQSGGAYSAKVSAATATAASSVQQKQQNRLSKKSLEESLESIDNINNKRKSVYSICSEERCITIVHIKSGDCLATVTDNAESSPYSAENDGFGMAISEKEGVVGSLTFEQIINQHDINNSNILSSTVAAATINRKSIIIIETNNSSHDQLIASILESTATATMFSGTPVSESQRNSKVLTEEVTGDSKISNPNAESINNNSNTNNIEVPTVNILRGASTTHSSNDEPDSSSFSPSHKMNKILVGVGFQHTPPSDTGNDLIAENLFDDDNDDEDPEQNLVNNEDEEEVDEEEDDGNNENNEAGNQEEEMGDEYDEEEIEMAKENLFDIYNEYVNDLSDVTVVVKEKRQQGQRLEGGSDMLYEGETSSESSGSNAGVAQMSKLDEALSCKNNLELLTKELNKMLDDIETQKFIINDKEIYFLSRIQNSRLLEQIKEEEECLMDNKDYDEEYDQDYKNDDEEEELEEYESTQAKSPQPQIIRRPHHPSLHTQEPGQQQLAPRAATSPTARISPRRRAQVAREELEAESKESEENSDDDDYEDLDYEESSFEGADQAAVTNATASASVSSSKTSSPVTNAVPLNDAISSSAPTNDSLAKSSSTASTFSSTSFSSGANSSGIYTLTPSSSSASVLYTSNSTGANPLVGKKPFFLKNEQLVPLSEKEELELMHETNLKLLKNAANNFITAKELPSATVKESTARNSNDKEVSTSNTTAAMSMSSSNDVMMRVSADGASSASSLAAPKKATVSKLNSKKKKKKAAVAAATATAAAGGTTTSSGSGNAASTDKQSSAAKSKFQKAKKLSKLNNKHKHKQSKESITKSTGSSGSLHKLMKKSNMYEDYVIYEFYFPRKYCGKLIGKNGCHVDYVRNRTNTQIAIRNDAVAAELQIVSITGRLEDVDEALDIITKRFPAKFYPSVSFKPISKPIIYRRLLADDTESLFNAEESKILVTSKMFVDYMQIMPDLSKLSETQANSDKELAGMAINVYVTSIVNATHVFIQLPTNPLFESLQKLDQTMLSVYNNLDDTSIPYMVEPIEYGTICVAPTYYGWHRAMVTNYTSREFVMNQISDYNEPCGLATIKFLDYGGYLTIPTNQLRQLRNDFMLLPFQAIECYLDEIYQFEENEEDGKEFLTQIVKNSILRAVLTGYADDGIPLIKLFLTNDLQQNCNLNTELVNYGYAFYLKDAENESSATSDSASIMPPPPSLPVTTQTTVRVSV